MGDSVTNVDVDTVASLEEILGIAKEYGVIPQVQITVSLQVQGPAYTRSMGPSLSGAGLAGETIGPPQVPDNDEWVDGMTGLEVAGEGQTDDGNDDRSAEKS